MVEADGTKEVADQAGKEDGVALEEAKVAIGMAMAGKVDKVDGAEALTVVVWEVPEVQEEVVGEEEVAFPSI